MILFLLLIGALGALWYIKEKNEAKKRPPGPMQLPILGSMAQVAITHPVGFIALDKLSKKYGDCMSIKLGQVDYAIVSSYDSIKHFFAGDNCLDRPCAGIWAERNFNKSLGLLFSNGPMWAETRKFSTQVSRQTGFMNRVWLKDILDDEVRSLVDHIDKQVQSSPDHIMAFSASDVLKLSFTNLICATLTGERHDYNNKQLQDLVVSLDKFFRASTLGISVMMAWPFLRFVFGKALGYDVQLESVKGIHKYSSELIEKHRKAEDYKNGDPANFIDAFLKKMDETKDDPNNIYTEEQFLVVIADFFTAGSETTANWLLFAILLLMTHPDKQEKMYKEIQQVFDGKFPDVENRDKMVYTQAVMHEVHRWAKVTINLGPRMATKDLEYNGRIIKKGTTILANIYPVAHDKAFWGDPHVFRPERFIGSDGEIIKTKTERLIQFGLGKRLCFGFPLASDSGFVYLTALFQRFQFVLPDEYIGKMPSLKLLEGITTCPEDFRAKLVKRSL